MAREPGGTRRKEAFWKATRVTAVVFGKIALLGVLVGALAHIRFGSIGLAVNVSLLSGMAMVIFATWEHEALAEWRMDNAE